MGAAIAVDPSTASVPAITGTGAAEQMHSRQRERAAANFFQSRRVARVDAGERDVLAVRIDRHRRGPRDHPRAPVLPRARRRVAQSAAGKNDRATRAERIRVAREQTAEDELRRAREGDVVAGEIQHRAIGVLFDARDFRAERTCDECRGRGGSCADVVQRDRARTSRANGGVDVDGAGGVGAVPAEVQVLIRCGADGVAVHRGANQHAAGLRANVEVGVGNDDVGVNAGDVECVRVPVPDDGSVVVAEQIRAAAGVIHRQHKRARPLHREHTRAPTDTSLVLNQSHRRILIERDGAAGGSSSRMGVAGYGARCIGDRRGFPVRRQTRAAPVADRVVGPVSTEPGCREREDRTNQQRRCEPCFGDG